MVLSDVSGAGAEEGPAAAGPRLGTDGGGISRVEGPARRGGGTAGPREDGSEGAGAVVEGKGAAAAGAWDSSEGDGAHELELDSGEFQGRPAGWTMLDDPPRE